MIQTPQYSTTKPFALAYGIPEHFIRREIRAGRVPGFYSGSRFYINVPAFLQELEQSRSDSKGVNADGRAGEKDAF